MKSKFYIFTIFILFFYRCSDSMENFLTNSNEFEITFIDSDYYLDKPDTTLELIVLDNEIPDIFYFNKKYHIPSDLPKSFISKEHKNVLINYTHQPNDPNYESHEIIRYDSLGRVIQYSLYPCIISSTGGYNYFVQYDSNGRIETIKDSVDQILSRGWFYEFDYFEDGEIEQIRAYRYSPEEEPSKVISVRENFE